MACALKRQDCGGCLLRDRCVYLYLFETPPPADTEMMSLYPAAPHPFIIEPPETEARLIAAGECLEFGLVLIGRGLQYLPYFIYAFMRMGEQGLGRGRGRFSLEEVVALGPEGSCTIYDGRDQALRQPEPFPRWENIVDRCETLQAASRITIRFTTPVRIKFDGHLVDRPQFHHLVRSLLRRLSSLSYFHCEKKLDLDFRGLIEKAHEVKIISSEIRWHDWERYSNRQKQRMNLGGFIGQIMCEVDLEQYLPLLVLGEWLHVGKAVSFGLGRYWIESHPPSDSI